jgi:hypothetical protein
MKLRAGGAAMTPFEFAFSLFSLLLGLSLAEVLSGFARAIEARRRRPVSVLVLLLAALVFLDIVSFWTSAWLMRSRIGFSFAAMLAVAVYAGAY